MPVLHGGRGIRPKDSRTPSRESGADGLQAPHRAAADQICVCRDRGRLATLGPREARPH
jgi:hypothetical protein